jgi:hypothetical protein
MANNHQACFKKGRRVFRPEGTPQSSGRAFPAKCVIKSKAGHGVRASHVGYRAGRSYGCDRFSDQDRARHSNRASGQEGYRGGLAGEVGSYLRLSQPKRTVESIKLLAKIPYDERIIRLRGLFSLPSGHPVFERVADKIGSLSPDAARGMSEASNIIAGARLMLTVMSSESFLQASDEVQVTRITAMADMFTREIDGMRRAVILLERLSRQSVRCYLMGGCD